MFADVPEGSMRNFNIAANATAAATTALMNVMPEPMEGDADLDPEFISRRYATIVQAIVNLMAVDFCCLGHSVETISQIASLVLEKLPRHVDLRAEAAASGDLQSMPCQGKA